jgi:hypothetical protein
LGVGFAFVGKDYRLEVGGEEILLDLLFYHLELRCFIIIDLKMDNFQAEYSGRMNLSISAVDEQVRKPAISPPSVSSSARPKQDHCRIRHPQPPQPHCRCRTPTPKLLPTPEQLEMELDQAMQQLEV